jgi:iron complex transport system substrate-binding protein
MRVRATLTTAIASVATATLLLAGCAGDPEPAEPAGAGTPTADGFPVTVGELTLTEQPTAIVSLSPAVTEMLFAIGAGDQVVAVDEFSNYPPGAPTTELSGFDPAPEAIASYDPDLVLISYDPGDLVDQLGALDIPVFTVPDNPTSLDDIYGQLGDLGALTGQAVGADELVRSMSDEIDQLVAAAPAGEQPLTYYFEIDDTLWTYTSQSLVATLFELVGLENIAVTDDPFEVTMQLSPEVLVDSDPDIIFLANAQYGVTTDDVLARDGWQEVAAVRDGHVVELSPDIASRWGPRVVDLLREAVDAVSQVS